MLLVGSYGVLYVLVTALVSEYELSIIIGWITYIVSIALTFGVSVLVGLMVARKNKKIDMVGALLLGVGMSLCMTDLSELLGSHRDWAMVIGIAIGLVGGILASLAYPIYNAIVKAKRKKLAPEIIRLTDELMK
ncbi:MAG: hypothetical protein IJV87_04705 [Clostridia bacterium]|nr:hypothetical protein [Clostridia bacterium]